MTSAFTACWRDLPEMNRLRPPRLRAGWRTRISVASISPGQLRVIEIGDHIRDGLEPDT